MSSHTETPTQLPPLPADGLRWSEHPELDAGGLKSLRPAAWPHSRCLAESRSARRCRRTPPARSSSSRCGRSSATGPRAASVLVLVRVSPKLRDSGDANAGGDLGKRYARQIGVLATCDYPARPSGRPLMINSVSRRGHRQVLLATFSRPKTAFPQLMSPFQATRRRNSGLADVTPPSVAASGSSTRRVVPAPRGLSRKIRPPSASTRSLRPTRPVP
jgi:hypothetical protein